MYFGRLALLAVICFAAGLGNVSHCLRALAGGQSQNRLFSQIPEPTHPDATEELEAMAADAAGEDFHCALGLCANTHESAWSVLRHRIGPALYPSREVTDILHRFLI